MFCKASRHEAADSSNISSGGSGVLVLAGVSVVSTGCSGVLAGGSLELAMALCSTVQGRAKLLTVKTTEG
jgi:hypothetical protein